MCNMFGNNSCSWIILLVIIWVACCGNNGSGYSNNNCGNDCGCGC